MDNFMDKLAHKMSASELIKANSAAEAMELKRLREQLAEYESILQETRKLNLKNTELTDQARDLVGIGLSDIRKALEENKTNKNNIEEKQINIEEKLSKIAENFQKLQENLEKQEGGDKAAEELMNKIEDFVHKENVKVYRNVQAVVVDSLKEQTEELKTENSKIEKHFAGIKPLLIITVILAVANIAINVVQMLGLF